MNALGIIFTLAACLLQVLLPRRFALLPLLASVVLTTRGQVLDLGGLNFTIMRVVIGVGVLRTVMRGEAMAHGLQRVDLWLLAWTAWLVAASPFHASGALVFRLGMAWDYLGAYFLSRVFLRSPEDIVASFKALCVMLVPVAVSMVAEKYTDRNAFSVLGGVSEYSAIRAGNIRATGPFAHPILAGTVGAALIGMAYAIRSRAPLFALLGLCAGCAIVFASTSSGPVLMLVFTLIAVLLQPLNQHLNVIRWLALIGILALAAVMKDPVYFLMARIDIAGGSTGWFRAQLIRSSLEHLDEWWLVGTDYTRHWMLTGNPANEGMTDITNHYLKMGVWGGLPLVFLFVMLQLSAFGQIGRAMRDTLLSTDDRSLAWVIGAVLFGHVMNFFSISLFDNTNTLYLLLFAAAVAVRREQQAVTRRAWSHITPAGRGLAPRFHRRRPTWR